MSSKDKKRVRGQFYTTNSAYILEGMPHPPANARCVIEPFAGKGDLLDWIAETRLPIEAYDIEPKRAGVIVRDTLRNPPDYTNAWILTNPPYLARNKNDQKEVYDQYNTNDLYKCFIHSIGDSCCGGILIIPAGFFFSPREMDVRCRNAFMSVYRITKTRYFEESVFDDTSTTVVAVAFEKSNTKLSEQSVLWERLPAKEQKTFAMCAENDWIIGGDIYRLPIPKNISIRRHVEGNEIKPGEQQTYLTLNALDTGTQTGRIGLEYKPGYVYPAKDCSRTFATLLIKGHTLTEQDQIVLARDFNAFLESKREAYWSLFLPQFRESKEYARKRIPFELAYHLLVYLIQQRTLATNQSIP